MNVNQPLSTHRVAQTVGLSVQQVRNYETWGFLPGVPRAANGYRQYTPRHVAALQTARTMIDGYGWQPALAIMQALHRSERDTAVALVNGEHAKLDRKRREAEQTLTALQAAATQPTPWLRMRHGGGLRVRVAAQRVGVRVSALRHWEQQGLLFPTRDDQSKYRLYDEEQLRRLQVIVLLRGMGYAATAIRPVLDEIAHGTFEQALQAIEQRFEELRTASNTCIQATAAFWQYAFNTRYP
jgi:DNA-binding transcriptional MerR regulator